MRGCRLVGRGPIHTLLLSISFQPKPSVSVSRAAFPVANLHDRERGGAVSLRVEARRRGCFATKPAQTLVAGFTEADAAASPQPPAAPRPTSPLRRPARQVGGYFNEHKMLSRHDSLLAIVPEFHLSLGHVRRTQVQRFGCESKELKHRAAPILASPRADGKWQKGGSQLGRGAGSGCPPHLNWM